jgi:polyhydroxybutyrate depolymerase
MWRTSLVVALMATGLSSAACDSDAENVSPSGAGAGSGTAGSGGMVGQGGSGGGTAMGCGSDSVAAGDHTFVITHGGLERSYNLHLPPGYDDATQLSLVLNFHGLNSSAGEQAFFSDMNKLADSEGFAVLYPEGVGNSWNAGSCCGDAASQGIDDVDFARQLVADVVSRACIDEKAIYSTGMSNGGFMSHRLACEASDLFAAVAPVDGLLGITPASCVPERPVPIMHFYGTADPLVEYQYAIATNDHWVAAYNCADAMPDVTYAQGMAQCETWDECDGGAVVTMCSITGMGHCWPGQSFCPPSLGTSSVDISANEEMWAFFQQHRLP